MRKLIPLFLMPMLFLVSCKEKCETPEIAEVYCFVDVTDTVNFDLADNYLKTTSKDENSTCELWNKLNDKVYKFDNCTGGKFRLYKINDVGENQFLEIGYPKEGYFSGDKTDFQIKDDPALREFKYRFSGLYSELTEEESAVKRYTKIFLPLCKALNQLNESKATRKIALIFSDMLENSEKFSFYNNKEIDAEKTLDKLEALYNQNFPTLQDIEIHIVSKRNTLNDVGIDKAEKFWKTVFTQLYPAKVFKQGATLDIR